MYKKFIVTLMLVSWGFVQVSRADEGMWPLIMIQKLQDDMQARGLKLTAEDIYSINKASMKDAIVRLMTKQNRMFCTGEVISDQGLFLTNHHCGYGSVQELSTPEDNILANGFWAKNNKEERKANFNIGLLSKIEDVTDKVLDSLGIADDETSRAKTIADRIPKVTAALKDAMGADKDNYVVEIVSFWAGNRYMAMYYQVFTDIRLVGVPPESIGKFGGETDNWMWPRHTCDISVFRIYANSSNKPAAYSADNKPYHPSYYFPVNIGGPQSNDYAMIMGYPGRTQRYTYSKGIQYYSMKERPMRVKLRRDILDEYEEYMHADPKIKLMYADKYATLSNYWKKFMGETDALKKLHIYDRRKAAEDEFSAWAAKSGKPQYKGVTAMYDKAYTGIDTLGLYSVYLADGVTNAQPMAFAMASMKLETLLEDKTKAEEAKKAAAELMKDQDEKFKEFYDPIEKNVLATVLQHLLEDLDHKQLPAALLSLSSKHGKDYKGMAESLWSKSIFTSRERMDKFMSAPSLKALQKDQLYVITRDYVNNINKKLQPNIQLLTNDLNRANRLFQAGMMEMHPDKLYSPDANATMRVTYGRVLPYKGKDAVSFKEFTTSAGVIEKYVPGDIEFDAPARLIDLMKKKDFGQYADKDGELHTNFITDNDITGGNSGSPVINAKGELIGTAFDGNWEAISSDFAFEPVTQRTICVDIRYTLFVIDKFGGAQNIIKEMKLVQ